ncbi:protoporphyrinogen/coproporphyrinogen oxidase [Subtercola frigoramans]|uniref:Oxygen-dependent protoporphyrinogen oxidase n=1 Tax=Subtercola frigoramans TaxID=120298 RepID=A0ABS2L9E6_9MICO|nr:FAD-dependent oxidoreductase [Subtercola frigoramans]MBM7473726.1 oxygen-dependent protoporphyrinogen oxidase [Subtercola frigoramans]
MPDTPETPSASAPEPPRSSQSVIVIGAGIGGLVAARELALGGLRVTVLDRAVAAGGCVQTHTVAGIRLDSGAESFATRGGTVEAYLTGLGLGDELVTPNRSGAWLQLDGFAAPLPKNTVLGIPGVPLANDVRAILGWSGSLRAQLDRVMPFLRVRKETDLGDLVRRRMGSKVLDRLVAPIVSGVHSAHPDLVDVHSVAPGLTRAMTNQGSLSGAVMSLIANQGLVARPAVAGAGERPGIDGAPGARAGSAVAGIDGGMYRLVEALQAECARLGVDVRLGLGVRSIQRVASAVPGAAEWMTVLDDGTVLGSNGVIIAAGFRAALELAQGAGQAGPGHSGEPDALTGATQTADWPGASAVTLATLVLDAPALDAAPRGTGVLVADGVTTVRAKALTHATAKWPWLARDTGGLHVVRLSYGRGGEPVPVGEVTRRQVLADASTLLGIPLSEEQVRGFALTEWRDSLAFATVGHRARVDAVIEAVHGHPGLEVVGAWISGTGLAYVIDGAAVKARDLAASLFSA